MAQRFDLHGQEAYAIGCREEMERCCGDICWMCADNHGKLKKDGEGYWHLKNGWQTKCHATNIRQRWAKITDAVTSKP